MRVPGGVGGVDGVGGGHSRMAPAAVAAMVLALVFAGHGVCRAQDSARTTRLIGRVVDSLDAHVAGATVELLPARTRRAVTDNAGTSAMDSVPVGVVQLSVR